ncbi:hypothetical protein WQ54_06955 [Bacillus sp. SA1-12]|uniref:DUF3885 domain-containing protein n=1 Tax=Bacillus sp. SA1-12 TaxID=1455638 RepID=UPI000625525B|nr:DUF3885 domain-containing protein [Bacillus sp. SA1-12]KKI92911.1 hypothetical protein WQ54_06955 [Bacillus sp. SA1-12]
MLLNDYLDKKFPNLKLSPPLFYNWEIGIRFELGTEMESGNDDEDRSYIQGVYTRAITLFKSLHSQGEEIYIVVDVNDFGDQRSFKHKAGVFSKYVHEKFVLYALKHAEIPYVFPEENEEGKYKTHRFILKCITSDMKYIPLLKAICNQDLGIQPSIIHRVYFLNIKRETIFHVYDDRGCDLLATTPDSIREIYNKYNDWILDYDRDQINKVFK